MSFQENMRFIDSHHSGQKNDFRTMQDINPRMLRDSLQNLLIQRFNRETSLMGVISAMVANVRLICVMPNHPKFDSEFAMRGQILSEYLKSRA